MNGLIEIGAEDDIDVIFGGIIPAEDIPLLKQRGIKNIFTPSDFDLVEVISALLDIIEESNSILTN